MPNENQSQRFIFILDYRIKIENSKDGRNTLQSKKIIFFPKRISNYESKASRKVNGPCPSTVGDFKMDFQKVQD